MIRLALSLLLLSAAPLAAQDRRTGGGSADAHRPPPGMCRIWIDGVPAARQPAPTDCATALRRRPPNARVIFGDEVRTPRRELRMDRTPELLVPRPTEQAAPRRDTSRPPVAPRRDTGRPPEPLGPGRGPNRAPPAEGPRRGLEPTRPPVAPAPRPRVVLPRRPHPRFP